MEIGGKLIPGPGCCDLFQWESRCSARRWDPGGVPGVAALGSHVAFWGRVELAQTSTLGLCFPPGSASGLSIPGLGDPGGGCLGSLLLLQIPLENTLHQDARGNLRGLRVRGSFASDSVGNSLEHHPEARDGERFRGIPVPAPLFPPFCPRSVGQGLGKLEQVPQGCLKDFGPGLTLSRTRSCCFSHGKRPVPPPQSSPSWGEGGDVGGFKPHKVPLSPN